MSGSELVERVDLDGLERLAKAVRGGNPAKDAYYSDLESYGMKMSPAAALALVAAARERDGLKAALETIRDLGSDGEHSGDRHARCRDIARTALTNKADGAAK